MPRKDWPHLNNLRVIGNANFIERKGRDSNLGNKVAMAIERQDYVKGFDMLLEAWKIVVTKNPDWILLIYGQVDEELELKRTLKKIQN